MSHMTRQPRLHRDVSHGPGATADADGGHLAGSWWDNQVRTQQPWDLHGKTLEIHEKFHGKNMKHLVYMLILLVFPGKINF